MRKHLNYRCDNYEANLCHPGAQPKRIALLMANGSKEDSKTKAVTSFDFELLSEEDIPGASLNGKSPGELNVVQLRRWLACRGAPTSGKKPQLIERLELFYS